jgi:HEPN domain-containing protein
MSPDAPRPGSPTAWLCHARSDLGIARAAPGPGVLLEGLCFHAQQAAEKAIKAVLVSRNIPVPRTHNVGTLLDLVPRDLSAPQEVQAAAILTDYAVSTRYPGDVEPVGYDEYRAAVQHAEAVLLWAQTLIEE